MKKDLLWKPFTLFFLTFLSTPSMEIMAQLTEPSSTVVGVGALPHGERRLIVLQGRKAQKNHAYTEKTAPPAYIYDAEINKHQVRIYSQPNQAQLRIEITSMPSLTSTVRLQIFSLNGSLVLQNNKLELFTDLDLSDYSFGMYILHLSSGEQNVSWKILMK